MSIKSCPKCALMIEEVMDEKLGGLRLPKHTCNEAKPGALGLVAAAAADPDLTPSQGAMAGVRALLHFASEGNGLDADGFGKLVSGIADLEKATSGGDNSSKLLDFLLEKDESESEE